MLQENIPSDVYWCIYMTYMCT